MLVTVIGIIIAQWDFERVKIFNVRNKVLFLIWDGSIFRVRICLMVIRINRHNYDQCSAFKVQIILREKILVFDQPYFNHIVPTVTSISHARCQQILWPHSATSESRFPNTLNTEYKILSASTTGMDVSQDSIFTQYYLSLVHLLLYKPVHHLSTSYEQLHLMSSLYMQQLMTSF